MCDHKIKKTTTTKFLTKQFLSTALGFLYYFNISQIPIQIYKFPNIKKPSALSTHCWCYNKFIPNNS